MPWTPGSFRPWFDRRVMQDKTAIWFTIVEPGNDRPVGFCGVRDINQMHRTAEYFITVGEADCRGKGYGTEATRMTLAYAFDALNLHSILLDVSSASLGGIRAYEKAGFREIGRRSECVRMGNGIYDWVYMECLATEFRTYDSSVT
jgi:diamine N-acetyltransferase